MKILRIRAYSEPEQFTGVHMMRDLDSAFANAGFVTNDLTPMPTRGVSKEVRKQYRHKKKEASYDGHLITYRFSMFPEPKATKWRMLRYLLCNALEYLIAQKFTDVDVLYSASTPPTQGAMCAFLKKKLNTPFIYELQDVFPDSLVAAGITTKESRLYRIGQKLEKLTYESADKIIVISESIKKNLLSKGVSEEKLVVIPNWVDTDKIRPIPKEENRLFEDYDIDRSKFIVLYAGNFGEAQGTEVILKAAKLLENEKGICFVLFGGGANFGQAKATAQTLSNVMIFPLLPQERVSEVYSLGDVALITCKPGTGNSSMPSKTWSIMACNTPIIASYDINSELNDILLENQAGCCVPPSDEHQLAKAIVEAYQNRRYRSESVARNYILSKVSKNICTQMYVDTIISVC